jgi:hypothetical protein
MPISHLRLFASAQRIFVSEHQGRSRKASSSYFSIIYACRRRGTQRAIINSTDRLISYQAIQEVIGSDHRESEKTGHRAARRLVTDSLVIRSNGLFPIGASGHRESGTSGDRRDLVIW